MSIDAATVRRVAKLARIRLPEDEIEGLKTELNNILEWVEQLGEIDCEGVEPMACVVDMTMPKRADEVTDGGCPEKILANAPRQEFGFFAVPKVIE